MTRRIRSALVAGRTADETMRNFRADGTELWNHVVISPVRDEAGVVTHFVGVQADVTDRVTSESGRRAGRRPRPARRARPSHTLTYAGAGHPPPLLRRADGRVECLVDSLTSPGRCAGSRPASRRGTHAFGSGDLQVLDTDDLVESRVRDIGAGIADLVDALALAPPKVTAEDLCASLMAGLRGRNRG